MKNLSYLFTACLFSVQLSAQSISESKGNTNSILLNGSAITLNITDPTLRLDLQRNTLFKKDRNKGYLLGISAQGANESGVAGIFNAGELVPSGKITALAGLTFSNNVVQIAQEKIEKLRRKEKEVRDKLIKLEDIKAQMKKAKLDTSATQRLINEVNETELAPVLKEKFEAAGNYSKISFWKTTAFLYGGISAKSFRHFTGYSQTDLLSSFTNENFRGSFAGLGINHQYRNLQFGATIGYAQDDNQSFLAFKTYNYERTTTLNSQTIKESKEIKAYTGTYGTVSYFALNVDFIANLSLDPVKTADQPRNYMFLNPYVHTKIGSTDTDLLPNTTDVGLGLYIFNSKSVILGGIYVELPDVSDNIEKSKVVADRNIRPALQKLSFGIVTRFKLDSFLKFQDL